MDSPRLRSCLFLPGPVTLNLNVIEDRFNSWNANRSKSGEILVSVSLDNPRQNHISVPNGNSDRAAWIDRVLVE
jgi:hypothetical protein